MSAIEQRARELLDASYEAGCSADGYDDFALRAIIVALTPPEGSDQNLLELAATFETCIPFLPPTGQRNIGKAVAQLRHMAMGYVLVPVDPTETMVGHGMDAGDGHDWTGPESVWAAMLAARPEVL